jgi:hypothetical protein
MKKFLMILIVLGSQVAMASGFEYHCTCTENNNGDKTVENIGNKVNVTNLDVGYGTVGFEFSATLDPSYHAPKKSKTVNVRFQGSGGRYDHRIIVEKTLLAGAKQGFMQIQGSEDGFWSSDFTCTLKN